MRFADYRQGLRFAFGCSAFAGILIAIASCSGRIDEVQDPGATNLVTLLCTLDAWNETGRYSRTAWRRLIGVAKTFQKADPMAVEQALQRFAENHQRNPIVYNNTKPLLLLRVLFVLPEDAPATQRFIAGWVGKKGDVNPDGTVNLGWPIKWRRGTPSVIDSLEGFHGFVYDPAGEYRFFLKSFARRQLK